MGYILYPIRDIFEATFTVMPKIGDGMNLFLMIMGSVACAIWIGLMLKYEKTEVPNRQ